MAIIITDECINCGACEPECPNNAIYEGAVDADVACHRWRRFHWRQLRPAPRVALPGRGSTTHRHRRRLPTDRSGQGHRPPGKQPPPLPPLFRAKMAAVTP